MSSEGKGSKFYRFGLTGWPLQGSSSPPLHQAALAEAGLDGEYRLYPVPPGSEGEPVLRDLLSRLRCGSLDGLNVTIPHKQTFLKLVDRLTPVAAATGAVNTLYLRGAELVGDNTDVAGFRTDLEKVTGWRIDQPMETPVQGRVLVLGAGGASRAVVSVLASLGWAVTLAARDRGQAFRLVAELKDLFNREPAVIELRDEDFISVTRQPVLIVNATPVGMDPETQASPISAEENLPEAGFVYDLITRPCETTLMRQARSRGLPAVNGLGMLLEQAALAFEQWTLHTASRDAMRAAIAQPVSPTRISKEAA